MGLVPSKSGRLVGEASDAGQLRRKMDLEPEAADRHKGKIALV